MEAQRTRPGLNGSSETAGSSPTSTRDDLEPRVDYYESLRGKLEREPTIDELKMAASRIPYHLEGSASLDRRAFNIKIQAIGDHNKLTEEEVNRSISRTAEKIRAHEEARTNSKRDILKLLKRTGYAFLAAVLFAAGSGVYVGSQKAAKDIFLREKIEQVNQQREDTSLLKKRIQLRGEQAVNEAASKYFRDKSALEERFYGPLPSLTASAEKESSLSGLERSLAVWAFLGEHGSIVSDPTKVIYDGKVQNTHIRAYSHLNSLLLTKLDEKGNISELHMSNGESPLLSLFFREGKSIRYVGYNTGIVREIDGTEVKYSSNNGDVAKTYMEHASKMIKEFKGLISRGPNAAEVMQQK